MKITDCSKQTIERVYGRLVDALRAVERDGTDRNPGERIKITGLTMGAVQQALNEVDDIEERGSEPKPEPGVPS